MDVTLRGNMSQIQSVGLIRFGLQAAYLLLLLVHILLAIMLIMRTHVRTRTYARRSATRHPCLFRHNFKADTVAFPLGFVS